MATTKLYDVIVVGAGVMGSSAALDLVTRGKRVLLLEQFPVPHSRGSSHGQSRIIRRAYDKMCYAQMMSEAYDKWHQLERDLGQELIVPTGMLQLSPPSSPFLSSTRATMDATGAPYQMLSRAEVMKKYPQLYLPEDAVGLYDDDAGALRSERALVGMQALFKRRGGDFRDNTCVQQIVPGNIVRVKTNRGTWRAKSLVVTVGPWAVGPILKRDLMLSLPLEPYRILVCYWRAKHPGSLDVDAPFPCLIIDEIGPPDSKKNDYFGLPALEYPDCAKLCFHLGPVVDPDFRDASTESWDLDTLRSLVKNNFPGFEPEPVVTEKCIYTMTPDEDFIVDSHPYWKNIAIGAGFSGHGFKLAPVIGRILGQIALGETPSYDISAFRMGRFDTNVKLMSRI